MGLDLQEKKLPKKEDKRGIVGGTVVVVSKTGKVIAYLIGERLMLLQRCLPHLQAYSDNRLL